MKGPFNARLYFILQTNCKCDKQLEINEFQFAMDTKGLKMGDPWCAAAFTFMS